MKQIIDGLLYDTDKATLIYKDNNPIRPREYYKTEKGTYFCYYVNVGIINIIREQVIKDILAERMVDKYIELFGNVEEG